MLCGSASELPGISAARRGAARMRILLTGARGLLAAALAREFSSAGDVHAFDRQALDITDEGAVERAIADLRPDVVLNCASFNDVDRAEAEPQVAIAVNGLGVRRLVRAAGAAGSRLVHYSTDFVFDGASDRPYVEEDRVNPRGTYAASKLLGEFFALECPQAYVLRVESLFGEPGPEGSRRGSLGTIVDRIRRGEPVPAFSDRTVSPTYTTDIAAATRRLIELEAPTGLYHCVNTGWASWVEIAREAGRLLGREAEIREITLASVKLRAPRPRYCALSNEKLAALGIVMPTWQDALRRHLRPPR